MIIKKQKNIQLYQPTMIQLRYPKLVREHEINDALQNRLHGLILSLHPDESPEKIDHDLNLAKIYNPKHTDLVKNALKTHFRNRIARGNTSHDDLVQHFVHSANNDYFSKSILRTLFPV